MQTSIQRTKWAREELVSVAAAQHGAAVFRVPGCRAWWPKQGCRHL